MRVLRALLCEPFVHFVALGALIFGLHSLLAENPRRIEVGAADLDRLRGLALKQWGREPDAARMDGMVQDFVREEVLYREAVAQGLERDDVVVRRRLAQKMEFAAQDSLRAPSDDELRSFFAAHTADYAGAPSWSFEHVYFSRDRRGAAAKADARRALAALQAGAPSQGDAFMLASALAAQSEETLARDFGDAFAKALPTLPLGQWAGPVESAYGAHLVRITQRMAGGAPRLEDVRERVRTDLLARRVSEAREAAYARLRARYTVVVDAAAPLAVSQR
jgi:hypothetical protein